MREADYERRGLTGMDFASDTTHVPNGASRKVMSQHFQVNAEDASTITNVLPMRPTGRPKKVRGRAARAAQG